MDKLKKFHPAWNDGNEELILRVNAQYEIEMEGISDTVTVLEVWRAKWTF